MKKLVDFSKYCSIKFGPTLEVEVIEDIGNYDNYYILGSASNTIISDNPPPLAILSKKFNYITLEENILTIGGATPSGQIHSFCKKHDLGGLEFLSKLPGTLGGLVKMNAGMKEYEIFNSLKSIKTASGEIEKKDIQYGYRYTDISEIIYEATFEINDEFDLAQVALFVSMRANQPSTPSAGSCFKNPTGESAGRLIDDVGLRGYQIGDMGFSEQHANFLVNYGEGNFHEALELIELAKSKVKEKHDIELELEVIIL